MSDTCPKCGQPMTGIAFVDAYRDGKMIGWQEAFCEHCEAAKFPYPRLEAERKARISKRMTHREAASALGITAPLLSQYEAGMHQAPPDLIDRMHDLYDMEPAR